MHYLKPRAFRLFREMDMVLDVNVDPPRLARLANMKSDDMIALERLLLIQSTRAPVTQGPLTAAY